MFGRRLKLFGQNRDHRTEATYQPGKSLGFAHPLHQHHHFLFLRREGRKFLPNQAFYPLEKLHVISKTTENFHSYT